MPWLDKDKPFYENLRHKKYDDALVKLLSRYVKHLEEAQYKHDIIYPTKGATIIDS